MIFSAIEQRICFLHPHSIYLYFVKRGVPSLYWPLKCSWIGQFEIDNVLDIGANVGRTVTTFAALFPKATIHAFEPVRSVFDQLTQNTQGMPKVFRHNCGLGTESTVLDARLNTHNPATSLLELGDEHAQAFPFAEEIATEKVIIRRLDEFNFDGNIFIKMDVQGFEAQVVAGGIETFGRAKLVLVELSFVELYKGQAIFKELNQVLERCGLSYFGQIGHSARTAAGKPLQADALYVRVT